MLPTAPATRRAGGSPPRIDDPARESEIHACESIPPGAADASPVSVPIAQTSRFSFPSFQALREGLAREPEHHVHSRGRNPTVEAVESKVPAARERRNPGPHSHDRAPRALVAPGRDAGLGRGVRRRRPTRPARALRHEAASSPLRLPAGGAARGAGWRGGGGGAVRAPAPVHFPGAPSLARGAARRAAGRRGGGRCLPGPSLPARSRRARRSTSCWTSTRRAGSGCDRARRSSTWRRLRSSRWSCARGAASSPGWSGGAERSRPRGGRSSPGRTTPPGWACWSGPCRRRAAPASRAARRLRRRRGGPRSRSPRPVRCWRTQWRLWRTPARAAPSRASRPLAPGRVRMEPPRRLAGGAVRGRGAGGRGSRRARGAEGGAGRVDGDLRARAVRALPPLLPALRPGADGGRGGARRRLAGRLPPPGGGRSEPPAACRARLVGAGPDAHAAPPPPGGPAGVAAGRAGPSAAPLPGAGARAPRRAAGGAGAGPGRRLPLPPRGGAAAGAVRLRGPGAAVVAEAGRPPRRPARRAAAAGDGRLRAAGAGGDLRLRVAARPGRRADLAGGVPRVGPAEGAARATPGHVGGASAGGPRGGAAGCWRGAAPRGR